MTFYVSEYLIFTVMWANFDKSLKKIFEQDPEHFQRFKRVQLQTDPYCAGPNGSNPKLIGLYPIRSNQGQAEHQSNMTFINIIAKRP